MCSNGCFHLDCRKNSGSKGSVDTSNMFLQGAALGDAAFLFLCSNLRLCISLYAPASLKVCDAEARRINVGG